MPEGRATSAAPVSAPAAPAMATYPAAAPVVGPVPLPTAPPRVAISESSLAPGMTREQILQSMGNPVREIQFDQRQWMIYPGFVAVLKDSKLESFEMSGVGATKVTVQSDPAGAEIYLDEQFVGSTPSILAVAPGKHAFRLHATGRADWSRQLNVLSGSDLTLAATLDKN